MSFNINFLANEMEKLFNNIILQEKIISLNNLKDDLCNKSDLVEKFCLDLSKYTLGKHSKRFLQELKEIGLEFNNLYKNFDDKLMIFIIGNGNVGKSTLLNSLIGYKVAETNFLPNTWKIDVYSPELEKDKAIIKYSNGIEELLNIDVVKSKVSEEENKCKKSKKIYNSKLNESLENIKTKEERDEIKKYLDEKYLYKSNIVEVRWPVEKNWLLEKCLLVDTPGLNQNLHELKQLGNINDYYHQADGVLWLLDGQTIAAANAEKLYNELNNELKTVGGIRDNIIAVINRIDLVEKNGGEEAVKRVYDDARKNFNNEFTKIVPISAQQAFKGINDNVKEIVEKSGILDLQNLIRKIFISKSETIKNKSKSQGNIRLVKITSKILESFSNDIKKYEHIYITKDDKLTNFCEELNSELIKNMIGIINFYCSQVDERIERYINTLSEGNGVEFIKEKIYKIDDFINLRDNFLQSKSLEIENLFLTWEKNSFISEYKYIHDNSSESTINKLALQFNVSFDSLNNVDIFIPFRNDNIFSVLENVVGKIMFFIRKNKIKRELSYIIRNECEKLGEQALEILNEIINNKFNFCKRIMDDSFENILFKYSDIEQIKYYIEKLNFEIQLEKEKIKLKDIIL